MLSRILRTCGNTGHSKPWPIAHFSFRRRFHAHGGYPYGSLDKSRREIRLLELYPGDWKDPIQCSIRQVALDSPPLPSYKTISYHWGEETELSLLVINGTQVSVPSSSVQALRQMRSPHSISMVWIDALCINQANVSERSHQVTLMGSIFRKSAGNLVALGEGGPSVKQAIQSIYNILEEAYRESNGVLNFAATCYDAHKGGLITSASKSEVDIDLHALENLLSRPWFSRLWVFQEAALAPSNVCIYGSEHFPLIDLVRAVVWILYKKLSFPPTLYDSGAALQGKHLWHFVDDHSPTYQYKTRRGISLSEMWKIQRWLQCSDSRDRVYALLGLCHFSVQGQSIPEELAPDYSRSADEILKRATEYMLHQTDNPGSILRYINHGSEEEMHISNTPTWVPNWDWSSVNGLPRLDENLFATYRHHGLPPAALKKSKSFEDLTMPGITIDRIVEVSDIFDDKVYSDKFSLQRWLSNVQELASGSLSFEESLDNLGVTLISGENWIGRRATEDDGTGYYRLLDYLDGWQEVPPRPEDTASDEPEVQIASSFYHRMVAACRSRRFFVTEQGRLGLGPMVLTAGDQIVALQSCATPYILRPQNHTYEVLGECYLHGVMQGEAVLEHAAREDPNETFTLV